MTKKASPAESDAFLCRQIFFDISINYIYNKWNRSFISYLCMNSKCMPHIDILKKNCVRILCIFSWLLLFLWMWLTSSQQQTTVRLEIVASFTWSLTYTGSSAIFLDNIYRTTWTTQYLVLQSSSNASYHLHQWVISTTWTYTTPYEIIQTVSLLSWDGQKNVYVTYTPLTGLTGDTLTPPPVIYFLDTTPPPLTDTYSWPNGTQHDIDPLYFSRYASIDTWVWLEIYTIQISNSIHFSTAIEFTTTGTELILWWWSVSPGKRYRRRWARDKLGNSSYGYPVEFTIASPSTTYWGGWWISSLPNHHPTPLSDQCPTGDTSWNYFDGICSPVVQQPILINVPQQHQVIDTLPRRERALEKLNNPHQAVYKFPNYDAPKSLTIYEYPPTYVYQDIYESDDSATDLTAYYQASFWKPSPNQWIHAHIPTSSFTSKFDWIYTSWSTDYLTYRFVATANSCSVLGQFCPMEAVCRDTTARCYQEEFLCKSTIAAIAWCLRKS